MPANFQRLIALFKNGRKSQVTEMTGFSQFAQGDVAEVVA